jgi:hypothetical protein
MTDDQTQEDAALTVAWRVAQASRLFATEAQVLSLARQIVAFAEGLPIVALPVQGHKRNKVKNEEE